MGFATWPKEMAEEWAHATPGGYESLPERVDEDDDHRKYADQCGLAKYGHAGWVLGTDPFAPARPRPPDAPGTIRCFACNRKVGDNYRAVGPVPGIGPVALCDECYQDAQRDVDHYGSAGAVLSNSLALARKIAEFAIDRRALRKKERPAEPLSGEASCPICGHEKHEAACNGYHCGCDNKKFVNGGGPSRPHGAVGVP